LSLGLSGSPLSPRAGEQTSSTKTMAEKTYYYINKHGRRVAVPESLASKIHNQMKKYLGNSDGQKTPPPAPEKKERSFITKDLQEVKGGFPENFRK